MILAIDVGNTNIVFGCMEKGQVLYSFRIATKPLDLASDYLLKMRQNLELEYFLDSDFEGAIMSSVVPQVNDAICQAVEKLTGHECMVVGAGMKTGVNIKLDDPGTLASDLLTGAVGALALYKPPIIVADLGTASTVIAVDSEGAFLGGAIVPGVKLSFAALSSGTSLLPDISINAPKHCIGRNTVDCMKSGAVFGTAAMLDGMIERMEAELGIPATAVVTGGIAKHIIPHCHRKMEYEPDLLLHGLAILYEKNKKK